MGVASLWEVGEEKVGKSKNNHKEGGPLNLPNEFPGPLFALAPRPPALATCYWFWLSNCWFASDVTAAMLVVKNKSISLRWEMNSILMQI